MRRRRPRGDDLPVRADINVTSLVDVAFVLLVIFIITAPILQGGDAPGVERRFPSAGKLENFLSGLFLRNPE